MNSIKYKAQSTKKARFPCWVLLLTLLTWTYSVQSQSYTEAEIKSAFICNFIKFTEWPKAKFGSDTSAIVIGLLGQDPFGEALVKVTRATQVGKRKVRLIRLNSMQDCKTVHAVYFGVLKEDFYKTWLEECVKNNILSMSEHPEFTSLGGIINFTKTRSRYNFQISTKNAEQARLTLSAKLLKLAELKD